MSASETEAAPSISGEQLLNVYFGGTESEKCTCGGKENVRIDAAIEPGHQPAAVKRRDAAEKAALLATLPAADSALLLH